MLAPISIRFVATAKPIFALRHLVFVDLQGNHVPFRPPPELEAAATGPNAPQQLDVDRSEEDRQLLTR